MSLSVQGLSYAYGDRQALNDVSFDIGKGQFCALLGPNGAGKSTLVALLTRLFVAPMGKIEIAGHVLDRAPARALAALGVVFQQTTLDLDLTVHQNLMYFAALQGLSGQIARSRIAAALARLDMAERAQEKVRKLNGGHRRRAEIARALVHDPQVLILDEPTVGLDAAARAGLTAHVHALCAETDLTVLWATHLTDEIDADDQLLVLHQGQIRSDGPAKALPGTGSLSDRFLLMTQASL